jgi:hypothetical protein
LFQSMQGEAEGTGPGGRGTCLGTYIKKRTNFGEGGKEEGRKELHKQVGWVGCRVVSGHVSDFFYLRVIRKWP